MQIVFIAILALFFGAAIANVVPLVWPGSVLALMVITSIALFLNGLIARRMGRGALTALTAASAREKATSQPAGQPTSQTVGQSERKRATTEASSSERDRAAESPRLPRQPAPDPAAANEEGTVKWFNRTKGFGFIVRASGDEIFVHQRSIVRTGRGDDRQRPMLRDGQKVRFSVANHDKGLQAEDVVALD